MKYKYTRSALMNKATLNIKKRDSHRHQGHLDLLRQRAAGAAPSCAALSG